MRIIIDTIQHEAQRYPTAGDWWWTENGELRIAVSDSGDWRTDALVALHELVEVLLCKHRGVTQEAVDAFDMSHPELDDPGLDPRAPYHGEHMAADLVERFVARELDVEWTNHEAQLEALG